MDELRQGSRSGSIGLRQHRFLSGLVISEFALSLVLLVGTGLLLRSFWKVLQVQPGFEATHLIMAHLWLPFPDDPNLNPYLKQQTRAVFAREVLRRIGGLPGVQSAVIGSANTPFSGQRTLVNFTLEGKVAGTGELPAAEFGSLTPGFSRTIGMPLVRGRSFTDADNETGDPVVLVDQTAAERYWPNQDPIGKRILLNIQNIPAILMTPQWTTIVGIVGRTKSEGLDAPYAAHIFVPSYQNVTLSMTIYVRTVASAESLQYPIRSSVQSVDPNLPVFGVRTMGGVVSDSLASRRFALRLMSLFAATALVLAAIGIYGVMSYFASQRVREIGIRMALGAQHGDVLKMVVWQGMSLALIGVLLGIAAAFVVMSPVSSLLFGVSAHDPITILAFAALLVAVALAANYIPAYRATKVDPMVALSYE